MIAALLLLSQIAQAKTPVCSPALLASCETFAHLPVNVNGSKALRLPLAPGATMIYNSLAAEIAEKQAPLPKEDAAQAAQAVALVKQAVAAAKQMVTGGIDSAYWTPEQRALLTRLDTVEIRTPKNADADCKTPRKFVRGAPEASYAPESHTMNICPGAVNLAPAALLLIVTHELGHAVSPCMMAKDQYNPHPEKFPFCKMSKDEMKFAREELSGAKTAFLPSGKGLDPDLAGLVAKLEKCGGLSRVDGANFHGKAELYAKLSSCLDAAYTPNWKSYLKANHSDEYDRAPGGDASLQCISIYDEHFADAFGARVFGKILEAAPAPGEMARVAMIEPASSTCSEEEDPRKGEYPSEAERFLLHLAAPATQKALGCVMPKVKSCGTSEFFTYPKVAGAAAEEKSPAGTSAN